MNDGIVFIGVQSYKLYSARLSASRTFQPPCHPKSGKNALSPQKKFPFMRDYPQKGIIFATLFNPKKTERA